MQLSRDEFAPQKGRRFGRHNPERMHVPFWEWMVRTGHSAYSGANELGFARKNLRDPAIWSFDRVGMSATELPDGRVIQVGGEHEDWYDPDFCIYNDVIVKYPDGSIEIYGYPESVFPPTDFHSATLVRGKIYLIGSLGYPAARSVGLTPVFALDCQSLEISNVATTGEMPGWLHKHSAAYDEAADSIIVSGGSLIVDPDAPKDARENEHTNALSISDRHWRRLT